MGQHPTRSHPAQAASETVVVIIEQG
jgi:hypothetical protein